MTFGVPVVFVGAGPGDPGLLTARGRRLLGAAQVVVFDADLPPGFLDVAPETAERLRVSDAAPGVPVSGVPALLVARAGTGLRVVRLRVGDGGDLVEEADLVMAAGCLIEVVPGVSVEVASAAYAGISLGSGGRVWLDGGLGRGGSGPPSGTLVARARGPALAGLVAGLLADGTPADRPAALVTGPGTLHQRTVLGRVGTVQSAAREMATQEPALLIVGDGVRSRPSLGWLERRPLHGRRILVTRPRAQATGFGALLEAQGAEVIALPTIRLEAPDDTGTLDAAIGRLSAYHWVVFTSANGVVAFWARLRAASLDARALAGVRIAAIGPETGEALRQAGLEPDVIPSEYRAEGLVDALRGRVARGEEVLLVRAAEARDVLPRELRSLGATVTIAPAYRTLAAKEGADTVVGLLEARGVDVVTFTSSSTVRGFMALLAPDEVRRLLSGVALAAIGPITAETIAEYGLEASIRPREYTTAALAAAIAAHFAAPGGE